MRGWVQRTETDQQMEKGKPLQKVPAAIYLEKTKKRKYVMGFVQMCVSELLCN